MHFALRSYPGLTIASRSRVFNLRFFVVTILTLIIVIPAGLLWHADQGMRLAGELLRIAEQAEEQEEWTKAVRQLRKYLSFHPHDLDALARLANATERAFPTASGKGQAADYYARILSRDQSRHDIRLKLAELQLSLGFLESARESVEAVLHTRMEEPAARKLYASILDRVASSRPASKGVDTKIRAVVKAYETAVKLNPGDIELAIRLGHLYREHREPLAAPPGLSTSAEILQRSERIVDEMVLASTEKGRAYLARYVFRSDHGLIAKTSESLDADLINAVRLLPNDVHVRLAIVQHLMDVRLTDSSLHPDILSELARETMKEAHRHLEVAQKVAPSDGRVYVGLAFVQWIEGDAHNATLTVRQGLENCSSHQASVDLNVLGAKLHIYLKNWSQAADSLAEIERSLAIVRASGGNRDRLDQLEVETNLLWAQWYAAEKNQQRNLPTVARYLSAAAQIVPTSDLSVAALYQLGQCRAAIGQWDLALDAYQAAVLRKPDSLKSQSAAAHALIRNGRSDEAATSFRRILRGKPTNRQDVARASLGLANALLAHLLRLPEHKRNWDEFESAVARARSAMPESPLTVMMEIQSLVAQGTPAHVEQAISALKKAEFWFCENPEFWRLASDAYLLLVRHDEAARALAEYEKRSSDSAPGLRARIAMLGGDLEAAQNILTQADGTLAGVDRSNLLVAQAEFALYMGQYTIAQRMLTDLIKLDPENFHLRFLSAQLAVHIENKSELERQEQAMRVRESQDGTYWRYCRVHLLLLEAKAGNVKALDEAKEVSRQLSSLRPNWNLAFTTAGRVAEAQGDFETAVDSYRTAFQAGDRRPDLVRRFLTLLLIGKLDKEALSIVASLPDSLQQHSSILPLVVDLALRVGDVDQALAAAWSAVRESPSNAEFYVTLSRALRARDKSKFQPDAEKALRRAIQFAPTDLAVWVALLHYYVSSDDPDRAFRSADALRGLAQLLLQASDDVSDAAIAFIVGRCFQLESNVRAMEHYYRLARQLSGGSAHLFDVPSGAVITDELARPPASITMGYLGDAPDTVLKVVGLLFGIVDNDVRQKNAAELLRDSPRLQAVAAVIRGGPPNHAIAIATLTQIPADQLLRGDHLLLARLYRRRGQMDETLEQYRAASRQNLSMQFLIEFAEAALANDRLADAQAAVTNLVNNHDGKSPAVVALQVCLLARQGNRDEAISTARAFVTPSVADDVGNRLQRASLAAQWLANVGEVKEGIRLLQPLSSSSPRATLVLAEHLSRDPSSVAEALELCHRVAKDDDAVPAAWMIARIRLRAKVTAAHVHRSDELFKRLTETRVDRANISVDLLNALAMLREQDGDIENAVLLCKRALAVRPVNIVAMNNLAWLLTAYGKDYTTAEKLIERTVRISGPQPVSLDTLGLALLKQGKVTKAIRILEGSVDSMWDSAPIRLHLAAAYAAGGYRDASVRQLHRVRQSDILELTPHDRQMLAGLEESTRIHDEPQSSDD